MQYILTKKTMAYRGRRYFLGDTIELSKKDAKALTAIRAVVKAALLYADPKRAEPDQPIAPDAEPDEAADLHVENRAMEAEPVELSERTGKPKRPYNRRDLSAEK